MKSSVIKINDEIITINDDNSIGLLTTIDGSKTVLYGTCSKCGGAK